MTMRRTLLLVVVGCLLLGAAHLVALAVCSDPQHHRHLYYATQAACYAGLGAITLRSLS